MKQLRISILMLLIFTVLTGVIYPMVITGIGKVLFRNEINGSMIRRDGIITGSSLIGQKFEKPEFFHGRPSAVDYDAGGSGGSNMGPTNNKFIEDVKTRAALLRKDFSLSDSAVLPSDLLFASGSGLDPHISVEAATLQAGRIAEERKIDKRKILELIKSNSERQLYFYGCRYVNVLKLNSALADKGDLR